MGRSSVAESAVPQLHHCEFSNSHHTHLPSMQLVCGAEGGLPRPSSLGSSIVKQLAPPCERPTVFPPQSDCVVVEGKRSDSRRGNGFSRLPRRFQRHPPCRETLGLQPGSHVAFGVFCFLPTNPFAPRTFGIDRATKASLEEAGRGYNRRISAIHPASIRFFRNERRRDVGELTSQTPKDPPFSRDHSLI